MPASVLSRKANCRTTVPVEADLMALISDPTTPAETSEPVGPSELGDEGFIVAEHFTRAEVDELCEMGTPLEAVMGVASRFTPLHRHWHRNGNDRKVAYLAFARGDDRWAKIRITAANTLDWTNAGRSHPRSYTMLTRSVLLDELLEKVKTFDHINRRVAKPFTPLTAAPVEKRTDQELARASLIEEYNNVVGLWWDIRLAEGYSPEAAQMLLALIVPIETLQRLAFPTDPTGDLSPHVAYHGSCPFTPPLHVSS